MEIKIVRFIMLLSLMVFIGGCSSSESEEDKLQMTDSRIYYEIVLNYDVSKVEPSIDFSDIVTQEVALNIADSVMAEFRKRGMYEDLVFLGIQFEKEQRVWIVAYWAKSYEEARDKGEYVLASNLSIALCAKDGRIVNIYWSGG